MNSFEFKFHIHDVLYTLVSNSDIYFFELEDLTTFFIFYYVIFFFFFNSQICHEIRNGVIFHLNVLNSGANLHDRYS